MTDLEKLAAELGETVVHAIETIMREHGHTPEPCKREAVVRSFAAAFLPKLQTARAAGRTEELKEALALHRESACHHLSEYRRHSRGRLGGSEEPEVHRALASHYMYHARRIRARIQELKHAPS